MEKDGVLVTYPMTRRWMAKAALNAIGRTVVAYVGSLGGLYLMQETLDFYETARKHDPSTFALVLTKNVDIRNELSRRGFEDDDMFVESVAPDDVMFWLEAADIAISFRRAGYAQMAASPTKVAEYLACGVPVISNKGIGDIDELLTKYNVGVLIDDFSPVSYIKAIEAIAEMRIHSTSDPS